MDLLGKRLGKYLIEAELGRGGMGIVYRAQQTSLDRTVALKVLAPNLVGDSDGRARFQREAKAIARLNHPGIVQVFDIEEEAEFLYLVMEFVEGEGLDKLLQRLVLPTPRTLRIVADIADALHFAHEKNVVHRDVKPANVLMTNDGRPKVADFGLAYLIDAQAGMTKTGMLVGSPSYMSPEQVHGHRLDRRTDVYSLGVVLFRMVTGRVPFVAESSHAILFKQVQEEPPDPVELNPELSLEVRNIVLRALAKNPADRFQTMQEFRRALLECLGEKPPEEEDRTTDGTGILIPSDVAAANKLLRPKDRTVGNTAGDFTGPTGKITDSRRPQPPPQPSAGDRPTERTAKPFPAPVSDKTTISPGAPSRVAPAPTPEPKKNLALIGGGIAVAVLILGGIAVKVVGPARETPTPVPTVAPTAAAPPTAVPTPPPATAVVIPTEVPTLAPPTVPPPTISIRPTNPPRQEPTKIAQFVPPATKPPVQGASSEYCLKLGTTGYAVGAVRDVPTGFGEPAKRSARPDSGQITFKVTLTPQYPTEGKDFFLKVNLENGGDFDVNIDHIDESVSAGSQTFRTYDGFKGSTKVEPGQTTPIYTYQAALTGGTSFRKTIRLVAKNGDQWFREIQIRPCNSGD